MAGMKDSLLELEVGHNCAVWVRIGPPVGAVPMPEGQEGELVTLSGEHVGWMVPGTVKEIKGTGFGNAKTRVYAFRAVVEDGERRVLLSGRVSSVLGLANVKRMVDRDDPAARDAPRHAYSEKRNKYRRAARTVTTYDYEDTGEL
jgi:hypothetical protein